MCLVYSIVYLESVFSQHFDVFSRWHLQIFSAFPTDTSVFSPCAAASFLTLFFVNFLASFCCRLSLFLSSFLQCFSNSHFCHFVVLFQLKLSFIFLDFSLKFCLFQLYICYCNQSVSIIFSCVHHFLISPVWKQQ